jgi:hypothetical protein
MQPHWYVQLLPHSAIEDAIVEAAGYNAYLRLAVCPHDTMGSVVKRIIDEWVLVPELLQANDQQQEGFELLTLTDIQTRQSWDATSVVSLESTGLPLPMALTYAWPGAQHLPPALERRYVVRAVADPQQGGGPLEGSWPTAGRYALRVAGGTPIAAVVQGLFDRIRQEDLAAAWRLTDADVSRLYMTTPPHSGQATPQCQYTVASPSSITVVSLWWQHQRNNKSFNRRPFGLLYGWNTRAEAPPALLCAPSLCEPAPLRAVAAVADTRAVPFGEDLDLELPSMDVLMEEHLASLNTLEEADEEAGQAPGPARWPTPPPAWADDAGWNAFLDRQPPSAASSFGLHEEHKTRFTLQPVTAEMRLPPSKQPRPPPLPPPRRSPAVVAPFHRSSVQPVQPSSSSPASRTLAALPITLSSPVISSTQAVARPHKRPRQRQPREPGQPKKPRAPRQPKAAKQAKQARPPASNKPAGTAASDDDWWLRPVVREDDDPDLVAMAESLRQALE